MSNDSFLNMRAKYCLRYLRDAYSMILIVLLKEAKTGFIGLMSAADGDIHGAHLNMTIARRLFLPLLGAHVGITSNLLRTVVVDCFFVLSRVPLAFTSSDFRLAHRNRTISLVKSCIKSAGITDRLTLCIFTPQWRLSLSTISALDNSTDVALSLGL